MAIASNITNYPITITTGQRIGQLVFTQASHPPITIAKSLTLSTRGSKGFGSTGIHSHQVQSKFPSLHMIAEDDPNTLPELAIPTFPHSPHSPKSVIPAK